MFFLNSTQHAGCARPSSDQPPASPRRTRADRGSHEPLRAAAPCRFADMVDAELVREQPRVPGGVSAFQSPLLERGPPAWYTIADHARFKYLLSLDGITASFRVGKLLAVNSVLLKEVSTRVEYFYAALRPHGGAAAPGEYLPIFNSSVTDWADIIAAARGSPLRQRELQEVALRGQAFAAKYLCVRARLLYWRRGDPGRLLSCPTHNACPAPCETPVKL